MSRKIWEKPGSSRDLCCGSERKSAEKLWKKKMHREMFCRFFCRPLSLALGGMIWFHLYSLCQFGRVRKNLPILLLGGVVFLALCIRWAVTCHRLGKGSLPFLFQEIFIKDDRITLKLNDYSVDFSLKDIVYYRMDKKYCSIALKKGGFYLLSCQGENREFVKLKLSAVKLYRRCLFRVPVITGWIVISLIGAGLVVRSAIPYNGKLSWYLYQIKNARNVVLVHDNIYEDKLTGILEDVEQKVQLPETLCLATSFSLHFRPDGKIIRFDTMIKGFDEEGNYVDSYLISYDADKSDKIRIDLHGVTDGIYEEEKDFTMLIEGMEALPVKQTVGRWQEEEYGILYYGWREFDSFEENIIYLSGGREIIDAKDTILAYPGDWKYSGYSISVYCPNDRNIAPYRYLYLPDEMFEELKWWI